MTLPPPTPNESFVKRTLLKQEAEIKNCSVRSVARSEVAELWIKSSPLPGGQRYVSPFLFETQSPPRKWLTMLAAMSGWLQRLFSYSMHISDPQQCYINAKRFFIMAQQLPLYWTYFQVLRGPILNGHPPPPTPAAQSKQVSGLCPLSVLSRRCP